MPVLQDGSHLQDGPPSPHTRWLQAQAAISPNSPSIHGFDQPAVQDALDEIREELDSSSSLDPLETSSGVPYSPPGPDVIEHEETLARSFRHSRWVAQRELVLAALTRTGQSAGRLERFCACGSNAWVLRDKADHAHFRLACDRCHDRFCLPCSTEKRNTVAINLRDHLPDVPIRHLTLTLKSVPAPLAEQLDRLYSSFARFRACRSIKKALQSGLAFLELKVNPDTTLWHPHLHVLFQGAYLPQDLARKTWMNITGDSYIVDIRAVHGAAQAASYVAKYASKALSPSVWRSPRHLDEAIIALAGRRTFNVFGTWTGFHLSKPPADECLWEPFCRLADLIERARGQDSEAYRILNALRRIDANEPTDTLPGPAPPGPLPNL